MTAPSTSALVLIVDDEPVNLAALSALLKPHVRVRVARSGDKAVALARKLQPDLVLLDVDMPGMDGYETCRQLRALPDAQGVPIIFVTGRDSEAAEERGFAVGGVDYVHKPVGPGLLLARVRTHLALRQALAEARAHEAEARAHEAESRRLLDVLLPPVIAQELRETGTVAPRMRDDVAVLFADLVGFTRWCNQHTAGQVVNGLQQVMGLLEDVAARHGVEKLKTIGDAFMGAAGLMKADPAALERALRCGQEMVTGIAALEGSWQLRVGVQVGPVVAGVIGRERFRFDIWGDTVNQASRFCSLARPGTVCTPAASLARLDAQPPRVAIAAVDVAGVGAMDLAFLG